MSTTEKKSRQIKKIAEKTPRVALITGAGRGIAFEVCRQLANRGFTVLLTHEMPGTLTKILAYGLATGISATRVAGQQHFPSDVIIGSALGWYFGLAGLPCPPRL